ncbi:MAG: hypothetical protein HYT93_00030 [Parcubacteria group bacterium]|nr:hypothetical protein [Parcubacteria group bacterium]
MPDLNLYINKIKQAVPVIFIVLLIAGGLFWINKQDSNTQLETLLKNNNVSFAEISKYFKELAEQRGAEYAFAALLKAPLPGNIDLHLLGHVVGDELFKQRGINGISICTDDFRNACSHSIVIGTLLDKGEGSLSDIAYTCKKAPGGSGAYTMCFHGLGHGVLAYTGYELDKAVLLCKKTGTEEYNNREYAECVGGTIMEMIGGGFHDKTTWEEKKKVYFKEGNPLYPCTANFMPKEVKPVCFVYLTPHLFEFVGANLGNPTPVDFEKAFTLCAPLPIGVNRDACFGGFGKEFTVLANNRDIRSVEKMNREQLSLVYEWCTLAKVEDGILSCTDSAVKSLYWGGENDVQVAEKFCDIILLNNHQTFCKKSLSNEIAFYNR